MTKNHHSIPSMTKQILYPKLVERIFSVILDFFFLSIITQPLTKLISMSLFMYFFQPFFTQNAIDISDTDTMSNLTRSTEFGEYIMHNPTIIISYLLYTVIISLLIVGVYFVIFWYKFGATPGKFITNMRVVNADDYSKLTLMQCIKRYLGYFVAFLSVFFILLDKQKRALHDKIAHTVVIKK